MPEGRWSGLADAPAERAEGDATLAELRTFVPRPSAAEPLVGRALSDREHREFFARIREGFFVGEAVRDAGGKVVDFTFLELNEAFTQQTDLPAEAALGRKVSEAIPGFPCNIVERYGEVVDTQRAAVFEVEIPVLDHRWYEARAHPLGGERFAVLFLEITERKKIERALADSQAYLAAVVDSVDQMIWSTTPDGHHDFFNRRFYEYTHAEPGSMDGDAWAQILHPDDHARTFACWGHSLATGDPYEIEYRLRRHDGVWRWVLARARAVRNEAGEIVRWMGTCTDIDDAKRAKDELSKSEAQFRNLADALPQLAWIADGTGWIHWYNRRWYEYTGTTLEEMQGWGWRAVHHPDHVDRVVRNIQHSWDTGEPWEDTFPLRGADGRYRWFLSRAVPVKDAEGRVVRWFGTNTDITERRKAEELNKMLIQEISHRVKNSLALVSSLLTLQARPLTGPAREALEEASLRVHAVAKVHDQLWRQADAEAVDLGPFIQAMTEAIASASPQHRTAAHAEPALVSADLAAPIGLLLNELLTNAYKHAYPEGTPGEVRVDGARLPDCRYRIEVSDRGRGLPPGFAVDRSRGSLGMRVISSLAAQLDGELQAGSAAPGARFTITFPLEPCPSDD